MPASLDDFRARFTPFHDPGTPERPWPFLMAVPSRCRPAGETSPSDAADAVFTPLARFAAPASDPLEATISFTVLPREIGAGDLALIAAERSGQQVLQRRDLHDGGAHEAELILRRDDREAGPWLDWCRVLRDGPRVYRIAASAPEARFEAVAETCALAVRSFGLLAPDEQRWAEAVEEVEREAPVPFRFLYPRSWRLTEFPSSDGPAGFALDFLHQKKVQGRLTVRVARTKPEISPVHHASLFRKRLTAEGFRLHGAPILAETSHEPFRTSHIYAPTARYEGHEVAAGLFIGEATDTTTFIDFVCPSRVESPWGWAVTKRAFEIVNHSMAFPPRRVR